MDDQVNIDDFYNKLLLSGAENTNNDSLPVEEDGKYVMPEPGFVIKLKNEKDDKIFLNICTSAELPSPEDISEAELARLLDDPDNLNFRVPLGLGNAHAEIDKTGNGCTVYDVLINNSFCDKIQKSNFFMGFFMSVVYEGMEQKYNLVLNRDWVKLKNKKSIGQIIPQKIRNKRKPIIQEMNNEIISEVSTMHKTTEPSYKIMCEPEDGQVEYVIVEISLPKLKTIKDGAILDVGEDLLILDVPCSRYYLNLKLPCIVDFENGGAQYNKRSKIMTVTIPVPTSK